MSVLQANVTRLSGSIVVVNEPSSPATVAAGANLDFTFDSSDFTQIMVHVVTTATHTWELTQFYRDSNSANISSSLADTVLASASRGTTKLPDTLLVLSPTTQIRYTNDSAGSQDVSVYIYGIKA